MPDSYIFTSESVTEGHPDKICDQISDAILDAILTSDSQGRVAVECAVTTGLLVILGEITTKTYVDMQAVARRVIAEIGYSDQSDGGFDSNSCGVLTAINKQSPEIAAGVGAALETRGNKSQDKADLTGAGDQGMMFGFACNETPELMPLPISAAHRMARRLSEVRKTGILSYLKPDGKTQVSVEYKSGVPSRIHSIIISTQHAAEIDGEKGKEEIQKRIASDLKAYVVMPVFQDLPVKPDSETRYFINPSGSFVVGGPQGDAGLTGRKIIVDTYGGYARHGGGAFSGKDPTKVDRSGAYMARYVAKNVVAAGLATACEVQIAYAIGVARPVSVYVTTFGTGKLPDDKIAEVINRYFDLRPAAIIDHFDLKNLPAKNNGCFYQKVAAYGHFGRPDLNLPWEALDKVKELSAALKEAAHV